MRLFPHVTNAEHKTQLPVPSAYHRILAEHDRLAALFRACHLSEHDAHHERLRIKIIEISIGFLCVILHNQRWRRTIIYGWVRLRTYEL